jgi:hypothetical protein
MEHKLIESGSQSLLYCAVVADSLPRALELEAQIKVLPSVASVVSMVNYLTEDQARKLALIRDIKREVAAIPLPELSQKPVHLGRLRDIGYAAVRVGITSWWPVLRISRRPSRASRGLAPDRVEMIRSRGPCSAPFQRSAEQLLSVQDDRTMRPRAGDRFIQQQQYLLQAQGERSEQERFVKG